MGGWISHLVPVPPEKREIVHTVHLRAPMAEINYTEITQKDNGFYPLQAVFSIEQGHSQWDNFISHIIDSCQIDRSKVVDCRWVAWVTKYRSTFSEDNGDHFTTIDRIINEHTHSHVLALYILDPDCEFYISIDRNTHSGILINSHAPIRDEQMFRPSDRS